MRNSHSTILLGIFLLPSMSFLNSQVYLGTCHNQTVILGENGVCNNLPYVLVFEDNFDGNDLDFSKWGLHYQGVVRDFNFVNEKEWFANTGNTPYIHYSNNIEVSNGTLKIIAKNENPPIQGTYVTDWTPPIQPQTSTFSYSSAEIISKYQFFYGLFEIRCKIPDGKGFWPAFWLYSENNTYLGTSLYNEIDVFEFMDNKPYKHNTNVHAGQSGNPNLSCGGAYTTASFADDFHIFTLVYRPDIIQWFVDGILVRQHHRFHFIQGQPVDCSGLNAFQQYIMEKAYTVEPMHIIANLSIESGNKQPDNTTPFPSSLEIDYIRYYKQMDCEMPRVYSNSSHVGVEYNTPLYSVAAGSTINIQGNFILNSPKQLELIASRYIDISSVFDSQNGTVFIGRIDEFCDDNGQFMVPDRPGLTHITADHDTDISFLHADYSTPQVFSISPNPSSGQFVLKTPDNIDKTGVVRVFDLTGKQINFNLVSFGQNVYSIDLDNSKSGVYFLCIFDEDSQLKYKEKLVKID